MAQHKYLKFWDRHRHHFPLHPWRPSGLGSQKLGTWSRCCCWMCSRPWEKSVTLNNQTSEGCSGQRWMVTVQYLGQRDDTFEGRGGLFVLRCQPLTVATPVRQNSHSSCLSNQTTRQSVENKEKDHDQQTTDIYPVTTLCSSDSISEATFRSQSLEWKLGL